MNRVLLKKCIQESKWLLLACGVAMFWFCWVRVWIVSQLDTSRFKQILDLLPSEWEKFSSVDFTWLITYSGRLSLTYDEPVVFLCVAIWAIARGSDSISGEIGRGTMEMLLAQPVSRLQVLLTHGFVTFAGIALLVFISWLATYVGIHTMTVTEEVAATWKDPLFGLEVPNPFGDTVKQEYPMSEKVDARLFIPAAVNLFALGFFLAGLTMLMSSWDRYRWRTIGLVVGIFIAQLIIKLIGLASDDFHWMLYGSILTAYEPELFVQIAEQTPDQVWNLLRYDDQGQLIDLGPLGHDLVFLSIGTASFVGAIAIFLRRDLPAPL